MCILFNNIRTSIVYTVYYGYRYNIMHLKFTKLIYNKTAHFVQKFVVNTIKMYHEIICLFFFNKIPFFLPTNDL